MAHMPTDNARKFKEMSHEEEYIQYVSPLERQVPESRSAAERRYKEYAGDIDNYYTYYEAGNTAADHAADREASEVRDMKTESAQWRFPINSVSHLYFPFAPLSFVPIRCSCVAYRPIGRISIHAHFSTRMTD